MVPPAGGLKNEDGDSGTAAAGSDASNRVALVPDERPRAIGPYSIVYTIGRGVAGTVYLAEQSEPVPRRITLKVIRTGVDANELIARFRDEQRTLALERHPGIAEVYDAGVTAQGRPYFVTEHCPGVPITEYCELSRLHRTERLSLFLRVCAAVEHAHRIGIVHGDIKPANVIVSGRDGRPIVKLTDFVVGKLANPRHAELRTSRRIARPVGRTVYLSPEQERGVTTDLDPRTDVYALGVLLHELLVGRPPSATRESAGDDETIARMRARDAAMRGRSGRVRGRARRPRVARRRPPAALPHERDLVRTARRARDLDPERRHATALALGAEVERYLRVDAARRRRRDSSGALLHESLRAAATFAAALAIFAIGFALGGLTEGGRGPDGGVLTASMERGPRPADLAGAAGDIRRAFPEETLPATTRARQDGGRAEGGATERRGWVERFLDLRRDLSLHTLRGHADEVDCVAFSADGRLLASGSKDRAVRIWNVTTGRAVAALEGHAGDVLCVGFSPDGALVASGSAGGAVRIWDVASLHLGDVDVGEVPPGDLQHGRPLATLEGHADDVDTLTFSPDSRLLASGSLDRTVRVWDVGTRMLVGAQDFNRGPLRRVAFSPDGRRLVAAFSTGTVLILDPVTLCPTAVLGGADGEVRGFAIDGTRAASSHIDGSIQLWSLTSGETFRSHVESDPVWSLDLRPGGRQLVAAAGDGSLRLRDAESGDIESVLPGHRALVRQVAYSPDGERIASASHDRTIRIWDAETTTPKVAFEGPRSGIRALAVSHDGRLVAAGGTDGSAWLWDAATGDLLATLREHTESLWAVAFSPSDRLLTTAAMDDVVLWSTETRERVAVLSGHGDAVMALGYHPDGRRLATGTRSGLVRVWHVASRSVVATMSGHRGPVRCVKFRSDGRRLASASHDGTARIWDAGDGTLVSTLPAGGGEVLCLAYGRGGSILATGSQDHLVRLWNVETGELDAVLRGHRDVVRALEFTPDGARLVSASRDGTLRFWDASTGEPIGLFESDARELACFTFSPDGARIVVGSNRVEAWDTELAAARALWRGAARRRLVEEGPARVHDPR